MTSSFAPVAPLEIHKRLLEAGVLGDYHLLLAHQVLAQPEKHNDFYTRQLVFPKKGNVRGGSNGKPFIIMDNSLIELGKPMSMGNVLEAGEAVDASVIVLPDVLGDRVATLEASAKAVDELTGYSSRYAGKVKTLGVAQGQTLNDIFSCARDLIQTLGVDIISIPRHVTGKIGTRVQLVRMVREYGRPVHLLGFSENLFDDFWSLRVDGVMGIDSALPIWYGLQGFKLSSEPPVVAKYGRRPKDYEQQTAINQEVIYNLRRVEHWASTARSARTGK